jgi:hypothetical protein
MEAILKAVEYKRQTQQREFEAELSQRAENFRQSIFTPDSPALIKNLKIYTDDAGKTTVTFDLANTRFYMTANAIYLQGDDYRIDSPENILERLAFLELPVKKQITTEYKQGFKEVSYFYCLVIFLALGMFFIGLMVGSDPKWIQSLRLAMPGLLLLMPIAIEVNSYNEIVRKYNNPLARQYFTQHYQ